MDLFDSKWTLCQLNLFELVRVGFCVEQNREVMPSRLGHFYEDWTVRGLKVRVVAKIDQSQRVMLTDQSEMGYYSQFGLDEV